MHRSTLLLKPAAAAATVITLVAGTIAAATADDSASAGEAPSAVAAAAFVPAGFVSPLDLDVSGRTIPDTAYSIPGGAVFLATNGNDANAGTGSAPVRSLNRAIDLAPADGTIVVRAGVHRDMYHGSGDLNFRVNTKPLTIQAYPHEQAWFDGTDIVPTSSWVKEGSRWYVPWSTPNFCDGKYYTVHWSKQPKKKGPCSHTDMASAEKYSAATDPQMAFVDGKQLTEKSVLSKVSSTTFYYDWHKRRLYIGVDPTGRSVALAKRAHVLVSAAKVQIRGLGFRRYASAEFEGTQGTMLYLSGVGSLIENSVFTEMAAGAAYIKPRGGVVRHNAFVRNGYGSFGSNGSSAGQANNGDGKRDGLLIEGNVVSDNNTERFGGKCTSSCGQAGIKIAHMVGFTLRYNLLQNTNSGAGFWCDNVCSGGVMIYNIVRNNNGEGIFYEVSDTGIIASNLIYNNKEHGIRLASANTKVYNNTLVNNKLTSLWVYDDKRNLKNRRDSDVGPDTRNVDVVNNVMYGGNVSTVKANREDKIGTNTGPDVFMRTVDYNSYYRTGGPKKSMIQWIDKRADNYKSLASFRKKHSKLEKHSKDSSGKTKTPFRSSTDFTIRAGNEAYRSGAALPRDVAAALGVPRNAGQNRGAFFWPRTG